MKKPTSADHLKLRHILSWAALLSVLALPVTAAGHTAITVTLYHDTQVQDPAGSISLSQGDTLYVIIDHTIDYCYTYNLTMVADVPKTKEEAGRIYTKPVTFSIFHDGRTTAYKLDVSPRSDLNPRPAECTLPAAHWTINVQNYAWALGVAGAFTVDNLTSPAFALEAGTMVPPSGGPAQSGYFVRQNRGAQDNYDLGVAAMLHLFHTDPAAMAWGKINWAPISFGVGIKDQAHAKYYLGTSLRFDTHLFLTVGVTAGSVSRLPSDQTVGGFTTNANALSNLGTRTRAGGFLSVSYTAFGAGLSAFSSFFTAPTPSGGATPPAGKTPPTNPTVTSIAPGSVGSDVLITGSGFGTDKTVVKVFFQDASDSKEAALKTLTDVSMTVTVPAGLKTGALTVVVDVGTAESKKFPYTPTAAH